MTFQTSERTHYTYRLSIYLPLCSTLLHFSFCDCIVARRTSSRLRNNENVIFRDAYYYHRQDIVSLTTVSILVSLFFFLPFSLLLATLFSLFFAILRVLHIRPFGTRIRLSLFSVPFVHSQHSSCQLASLPQILPSTPFNSRLTILRTFLPFSSNWFHGKQRRRRCFRMTRRFLQ